MKTGDAEWKKFTQSGRVADYMAYKKSLQSETAESLEPERTELYSTEDCDDSEHRRTGYQGERDGRE